MIMGTKYITIPFDLERAKRISNHEEDGKIVTRDGRNVRIICWDAHRDDNVIALIEDEKGIEFPICYVSDGLVFLKSESTCDLMLSVPEWATFKDGDIVSFAFGAVSILKELGHRSHSSYFTLISDAGYFNNGNWANENMRQASKDEKNNIISYLKSSYNPLAKEYLKRFFGIEEKKEEKERLTHEEYKNGLKERTESYIDTYVNPNKSWKLGVKAYTKIQELTYKDIDWSYLKDYICDMDYYDFLQTPYWKAISEKVRQKAGFKCQICNSGESLNVHHRCYKNHGDELHHMEDLICICKDCHEKHHFE